MRHQRARQGSSARRNRLEGAMQIFANTCRLVGSSEASFRLQVHGCSWLDGRWRQMAAETKGKGQRAVQRHSIADEHDAMQRGEGCDRLKDHQSARQDSRPAQFAQFRNAGGMIGRELAGIWHPGASGDESVLAQAGDEELRGCGCGGAEPLPDAARHMLPTSVVAGRCQSKTR